MTMTMIFKFPPFLNPPKKVSVGNASKKETKGPFNRWNWENSAWTAEEPPRQSSWKLAERDWPPRPGFFGERWGANGSETCFWGKLKKKPKQVFSSLTEKASPIQSLLPTADMHSRKVFLPRVDLGRVPEQMRMNLTNLRCVCVSCHLMSAWNSYMSLHKDIHASCRMIDPKLIENKSNTIPNVWSSTGNSSAMSISKLRSPASTTSLRQRRAAASPFCFCLGRFDTPEFPVISTIIQGTPESRPLIPSQPRPKQFSPKSLVEGLKKSLKGITSDAMYL